MIMRLCQVLLIYHPNEIILENGSDINILPIAVNNTNVSVYGRAYREGEYPAFSGTVDGEIKSSS